MGEDYRLCLEKAFGLDFKRELAEIVQELGGEINDEKEFAAQIERNEQEEKITIEYKLKNKASRVTGLCIAAGLPNEEFVRAERIYEIEARKTGYQSNYMLKGGALGGSLAQYAAIMSAGKVEQYKAVSYNGLGLSNFLQFQGNEFLGYKLGLLYYLKDICSGKNNRLEMFNNLVEVGVIENKTISDQFRQSNGQQIKTARVKEKLAEILEGRLGLSAKKAAGLLDKNFNPRLIERKMRFIDKYKEYNARTKDKPDNIINYIMSDNLPAQLVEQIGAAYLVDQNLKGLESGIDEEIIERLKRINDKQLTNLIEHKFDLFKPYRLKEEGRNGRRPVNRLGNEPELGQITNNLSYDYLRALIKDIILDLHTSDEMLVTELFKRYRRYSSDCLVELITDRLRHSMKLSGKLSETEITYKSPFREENPDLFSQLDKVYPLDRAALEQIEERMCYNDRLKLWDWKLSGDGIFMVLGTELEGDEEPIEYHSSDSELKFTNEKKEIKLKLEEPSKNIIYGTVRQTSNYSLNKDTEYRYKETDCYNFSSGQGVGFSLATKQVDPDNKLKIDGENIARTYKQKDPEKVELGNRKTSLSHEYYGDNIILRNPRKSMGKIIGDLIYLYGPNKKNELCIKGFVNGDYGIELKRKVDKQEEKEVPRTYTPHKVRLNKFEFEVLDRFEVKKELYDHTRILVEGKIDGDNWQEYRKKLSRSKPKLVINYHDDNRKILFKGYINKHNLHHKNHEYYLKLEAISYTAILDRKQRTRIFQNQGTTYGQIFKVIEDKAKEVYDVNFNIVCDDSSLEDKPLVTKEYPVILQYRETDWEFLQRICSYLNKPLIIDDMKDTSETINILVGTHAASAKDLNNVTGRMKRKTVEDPDTVYDYYKVEDHPHYRSDEIFNLGKPVDYIDHLAAAKRARLKELILIKNKIYVKQGLLYSDLTMAAEDKINIQRREREQPFEGAAFRAEVKKVNNKHQAQVKFLDVYNQYQEDKAHWYAIDKLHTNAYFAPEVGDIVDVYFGGRSEKYGRIKSSSVVKEEETDHPPHVKRIQVGDNKLEIDGEEKKVRAAAGQEEKVYLDVTSKKIELANREQSLNVEKDKIKFENQKNKLEMNEEEIRMESGASRFVTDDEKTELKCGNKGITITDDKIKMP